MGIVVQGLVGSAEGTSISSLSVPLTVDVLPPSGGESSMLFVFIEASSVTGASVSLTCADSGEAGALAYCNVAEQYRGFGGVSFGSGSDRSVIGGLASYIVRSLPAGTDIVVSFSAVVDYAHVSLVWVTGVKYSGSCPINTSSFPLASSPGAGSKSSPGAGATVSDPRTLGAGLVVQQLGELFTAGVGGLTFADGATVLDSWYDRGPTHSSGVIAAWVTAGGSLDMGGTSDTPTGAQQIYDFWLNLAEDANFPASCDCSHPVLDNGFRVADS